MDTLLFYDKAQQGYTLCLFSRRWGIFKSAVNCSLFVIIVLAYSGRLITYSHWRQKMDMSISGHNIGQYIYVTLLILSCKYFHLLKVCIKRWLSVTQGNASINLLPLTIFVHLIRSDDLIRSGFNWFNYNSPSVCTMKCCKCSHQ